MDTIAAVSTPIGRGALGIIRISGQRAEEIAMKVFKGGKASTAPGYMSHRLYHGYLIHPETKNTIDEIMMTIMRKPHSYTGEDTVELTCHGGGFILQTALEAILGLGIRVAQPGEFTRRAFRNGKMDLLQAEAVVDMINAETDQALNLAREIQSGDLSRFVHEIKDDLIGLITLIEADIDFPEEDTTEVSKGVILEGIAPIKESMDSVLSTFKYGRILRDGATVVIAGPPNVGKSTLMNALVGSNRAIVNPSPGTTRDYIEEQIQIDGLMIKLVDTAGLGMSLNDVELEGMSRTQERMGQADLILYVMDVSTPLIPVDLEAISNIQGRQILIAINKVDLRRALDVMSVRDTAGDIGIVEISALKGEGLNLLRETLRENLIDLQGDMPSRIITRFRHYQAFEGARRSIDEVERGLSNGVSVEFLAMELKEALRSLKELIGEVTSEDILNGIFSEFCIGK